MAFWEAECSGGEAVAGPFGRQPDRNDLVNDGCGAGKSHRCRFAVDRFVAAPQKHDAQRRGVIRKNCVHHHTVPGRRGFLSRWVCSPPWNATRPLLRERRQRLPPFHLSTRPSPPQKKTKSRMPGRAPVVFGTKGGRWCGEKHPHGRHGTRGRPARKHRDSFWWPRCFRHGCVVSSRAIRWCVIERDAVPRRVDGFRRFGRRRRKGCPNRERES